jgi:hypothetical protein
VTIWSEKSKVGFDFRYSRKTLEEIEKLLVSDYPQLPDWVPPPLPIVDLPQFYRNLSAIRDFMPEIAAIGMTRNDPVGTMIRWHTARHVGGDGRVPVMDFVSCSLFHSGRHVQLRNGHLEGLHFCGGNTFAF